MKSSLIEQVRKSAFTASILMKNLYDTGEKQHMEQSNRKVDVAIMGSGIGGSTLASALARQGRSVIVFEGDHIPRFTIGESMIFETSEVMCALANTFNWWHRACLSHFRTIFTLMVYDA